LLVLDAYSSDAIPVHLMTREALQLYLRKLSPTGILAFHISNRHLDLETVVGNLARDASLVARERSDRKISNDEDRAGKNASQWVVVARHEADLGPLLRDERWKPAPTSAIPPWTDDYSSILPVLTWR
jgi:hypothetical protein